MGRAVSTPHLLFPVGKLSKDERRSVLPQLSESETLAAELPTLEGWLTILREAGFNPKVEENGQMLNLTNNETAEWTTIQLDGTETAFVRGHYERLFPVLDQLSQAYGALGLAVSLDNYLCFPRHPRKEQP